MWCACAEDRAIWCEMQVYKATWNDVQTVAVKQLLSHDARNDIRFLREIAILKECRSTHVVQFLVCDCCRPLPLPKQA